MEGLVIRPMDASDERPWSALWSAYLHFYGETRAQEVFRTTFGRLTDADQANCAGLIALINGKAVGLAHYLYHLHLWQKERTCYLQDLFVEEPYRKLGIAGKLIEKVYAQADAGGAKGVYWTTQDTNTRARRLYDRIGVLTPFIKYKRP